MSLYYPALSLDDLFFAYPDDESLRFFYNETLGQIIKNPANDISEPGNSLLTELLSISVNDGIRLEKAFFVKGMAENVAVIACWLAMNSAYFGNLKVEDITDLNPEDKIYDNRYLSLAITNDLFVDSEGSVIGDMDPESIGLIDAARRAVNQYRRFGVILNPINKVDDNLMNLVNNLRYGNENCLRGT